MPPCVRCLAMPPLQAMAVVSSAAMLAGPALCEAAGQSLQTIFMETLGERVECSGGQAGIELGDVGPTAPWGGCHHFMSEAHPSVLPWQQPTGPLPVAANPAHTAWQQRSLGQAAGQVCMHTLCLANK